MSDLRIRDGLGSGNVAEVDESHKLNVRAVAQNDLAYHSAELEAAFQLGLPQRSVTAATEYPVMRFKNTDPNRKFAINRIFVGYNGGDTTGNKCVVGRTYVGMLAPSANATATTPGNLNFSSKKVALADGHIWDGVGNGMTVAANGVLAQTQFFAQGMTTIVVEGSIILGLNDFIAFTVTPEETGKVALIMSGFFFE